MYSQDQRHVHLSLRVSPGRSVWRRKAALLGFTLVWLALVPAVRALDPPPDGGYPNGNTAEGQNALASLTTGSGNTAVGQNALIAVTAENNNTATGVQTLSNNTANDNTANGAAALQLNTTGSSNTASGAFALQLNTTGESNAAFGAEALSANTTGSGNLAYGRFALYRNTKGDDNVAIGYTSLQFNKKGNANMALGRAALSANTGSSNIALGADAGSKLTTGDNNIDIGAVGAAGESNTIRIGRNGTHTSAFFQGIYGRPVTNGVPVMVNSNGRLGVNAPSSERFKQDIKPMNNTSEALLSLHPVTFRYKPEMDPDGLPQFGLVAEQVEKVNPALVIRGADGRVDGVRYEAVNAMLLNEFLKEHRQAQDEQQKVANLEAAVAQQKQQIETLATALQTISDRVELRAPNPQVVSDAR